MARPIVFADANVLYAAPLRDLLLELAIADAITLHWSDAVQNEWGRALQAGRPDLASERIARVHRLMEEALPTARVAEPAALPANVMLPDPADHHVLAAALAAAASFILTFNVRDFPAATLSPLNITAIHPDHFLTPLCAAVPDELVAATRRIRRRLTRPPLTANEHLGVLARVGLPNLAVALSKLIDVD